MICSALANFDTPLELFASLLYDYSSNKLASNLQDTEMRCDLTSEFMERHGLLRHVVADVVGTSRLKPFLIVAQRASNESHLFA